MSYYGSCGKLIVLEIGAIPLEITAITPWMWDQALGSTHNGSHSFFDYTPAYGKLTFCQLIYRTGLSHLNFCPWRVKTIYQMWIICSHAPHSNFFQKGRFSKGSYQSLFSALLTIYLVSEYSLSEGRERSHCNIKPCIFTERESHPAWKGFCLSASHATELPSPAWPAPPLSSLIAQSRRMPVCPWPSPTITNCSSKHFTSARMMEEERRRCR